MASSLNGKVDWWSPGVAGGGNWKVWVKGSQLPVIWWGNSRDLMSSMRALVNNPAPHSWNLLRKQILSSCLKKGYVEAMGMLAWLWWLFQIVSNHHGVHLQYITILCVNYTSVKLGKKEQWDEKWSWAVEPVNETLAQAVSPCWLLVFITCLLPLGKDVWPVLQAPGGPCVFCEQETWDMPLPQSMCLDGPRPLLRRNQNPDLNNCHRPFWKVPLSWFL